MDEDVISQAMDSSYMVFTHPNHYTIDGDYIFGLMGVKDVQCGVFLNDHEQRKIFHAGLFSKKRAHHGGAVDGNTNCLQDNREITMVKLTWEWRKDEALYCSYHHHDRFDER